METSGAFTAYDPRSDEELITLVRGGDEAAFSCLCVRYFPLCKSLAAQRAGAAVEAEDLSQEGMLGFIEATRRYDPGKGVPFQAYARRCILSKMYSVLGAATAAKRKANVGSFPLNEEVVSTGPGSPAPEELFIAGEETRLRSEKITSLLSKSENEALRFYLRGCSYAQIAALTGVPQKSVDNALQRVRRKLRAAFGS